MRSSFYVLVAVLMLAGASSQMTLKKQPAQAHKKPVDLKGGVNGGNACMVCTVLVSLTEQLSMIYNQTVDKSLDQLCNFLPAGLFRQSCVDAVNIFGPAIISG